MSTQPTPTPNQTALKAKIAARLELRRRFTELRLEASRLLTQAEQVAIGLSEIEVQQARAAGKLAGVDFYSLPVVPDAADFRRLDEDLLHIARTIDPLILAIGEDAKANSHVIDDNDLNAHFKDQLEGALLGNATFMLEQCGEAAQEAIDSPDTAAEHAREFQTAE